MKEFNVTKERMACTAFGGKEAPAKLPTKAPPAEHSSVIATPRGRATATPSITTQDVSFNRIKELASLLFRDYRLL